MSISFQCPQCGKKLKAPDNAAGKSSTCPGCGNKVTCPEPVYDAEVVEMELTPEKPKGFDPFADLDDDKPYGVAGTPPDAQSSDDNRRPCPMCGEMIVATAAKCRYCGEVFDETIRRSGKAKSGKGKKKALLRSIAQYQRYLLICILIQILAWIAYFISFVALKPDPNNLSGSAFAVIGLFFLVLLVAGLAATVFAFMLTMKLSNVWVAILVLLLSLVPCAGLIALLVINGIATNRLRNNGISVGFFGADMSDF
jgi:predicted RNA-binding Zn-ribbon protein involved in translation (DUF1610 family)